MTVMVFGVFDGLHEGHRIFLKSAREYGALAVVIARDSVVEQLKRKKPFWHELKRLELVRQFLPQEVVMLGDEEQGRYHVVRIQQPDMICLGYDQDALKKDLKEKMADGTIPKISLIQLKPHDPEQYNSTRLAGDQPDHRSS